MTASGTTASDPLFDTLFRPTTGVPPIASAAPVREPGTRSRAGNAMNRTRRALLDGARRAVLVDGTKLTMAHVAAAAGVAKATLYNHFRTREAVLSALVLDEVASLAARAGDLPLERALAETAHALATHPAVRTLARLEPGVVAALGCIDLRAEGWRRARDAVAAALAAEGLGGTDFVLRWLASYLLSPAAPGAIAADVALLVDALPPAVVAAPAAAPVVAPPVVAAPVAGVRLTG
jgi:AcrR family transcriptional regulator